MPKRHAPAASIVSAALDQQNGRRRSAAASLDDDDEDEDAPAQLPPGCPKWEVAVVRWLRSRSEKSSSLAFELLWSLMSHTLASSRRCPALALEWIVLLRPSRFLTLLLFILGCLVSSRMGLGPVFVLVSESPSCALIDSLVTASWPPGLHRVGHLLQPRPSERRRGISLQHIQPRSAAPARPARRRSDRRSDEEGPDVS